MNEPSDARPPASGTAPPIAATSDDHAPARKLYVELATRITTQPLHYHSGDEEAAAKSVSTLFAATRELLTQHPKAFAFEIAVLAMLNDVVRPYTARWHRWMVDEKFQGEAARRRFRAELQQLRPALEHFREHFRQMADAPEQIPDAAAAVRAIVEKQARRAQLAYQGEPVKSGIGTQIDFAGGKLPGDLGSLANASQIMEAEQNFIRERRTALGRSDPGDNASQLMDATALCLSGGGIRSATFCLGIVQVLVKQKIFEQFDYLSTVSGGGYLGTFLSCYLGTVENQPKQKADPAVQSASAQNASRKSADAAPVEKKANEEKHPSGQEIRARIDAAFQTRNGRESAAVRHLRNNSKYLLSGGLAARARVLGLLVTGVATNMLLLLPIPLLAVLAVYGLKQTSFWGDAWEGPSGTPVNTIPSMFFFWRDPGAGQQLHSPALALMFWFGLILAFFWFLLPAITRSARGAPPLTFRARLGTFWRSVTILAGVAVIAAHWIYLLPAMFRWFHDLGPTAKSAQAGFALVGWEKILAIAGLLTPLFLGPIAAQLKNGTAKRIFIALFALSGPLLCLLIFLLVGDRVLLGSWTWWAVGIVAGSLTLWGGLLVDINNLSPRGYYRDRLCECYLAVRGEGQRGLLRHFVRLLLHGRTGEDVKRSEVHALRRLPLSRLNESHAAPYHLIHATVNLPSSREPNLRGRQSDFFMFSRAFCGGPICGYFSTADVLEKLDPYVDTGTAMAISGAAASSNMGVKTMRQFRFLLALLNVRLGYWLRRPQAGRAYIAAPGPFYLFREMLGWMHEKSSFLNLSDGGHIENLALYEILRRRCKYVVVVDGGMDPAMECADLMLAQRYAAIDLGVRLEFDLSDLTNNDQGQARAYAVLGKINYDDGALGWLVYIKLAFTGEEPGYVQDYRRQNRDFPHQSTGDQIYDEAQFEAYRRLGEVAAESLFRDELARRYFELKEKDKPSSSDVTFTKIEHWFAAMATSFLPDNDAAFPPVERRTVTADKAPEEKTAPVQN